MKQVFFVKEILANTNLIRYKCVIFVHKNKSMFKKLLALLILCSTFSSFGQSPPTIYSYTVDTLCQYDDSVRFITITIEDLDGDSSYIDVVTYNDFLMDGNQGYTVVDPPYSPGATLRTFEVYGSTGFGLPNDLNLASVNFEIVSGLDNPDYDINDIPVYGDVTVTMDITSLNGMCNTDNPVDLSTMVSPSGGTFTWGVNGDHVTNDVADLNTIYLDQGDGIFYDYFNASGCPGYGYDVVNIYGAPTVSVTPTSSTCGNADGSANATILTNAPPNDVVWTNGFSETVGAGVPSLATGLAAGNYYINVTDANGCTSQQMAQITDGDLLVTETLTHPTCLGDSDGGISLNISTSGNPDVVFWSNSMSGNPISGLGEGEYTVLIQTDNGCTGSYTYNLAVQNPLIIDEINLGYADCLLPNPLDYSDIDIDVISGQSPYTYLWSNGATTEDLDNVPADAYTCTITDANNCQATYQGVIPDYGAPDAWASNITSATCGGTEGAVDLGIWSGGTPVATILWSNAATTQNISGLAAGDYSVVLTGTNGCIRTIVVTVPYILPETPEMCLLTVDTSLVYNQVVWEKNGAQGISGYNVYRETMTQGTFELISTRPFNLESTMQDNAASPNDKSWRYRISAYDACGNESSPSLVHKTIHTIATTSNGTDYTVTWDDYEGISYSSVDLFSHDDVNGWQTIGNYASGTNSAPTTPTELSGLDYFVSFNLSSTCTSTKATDYNSSRSNKSLSAFNPGGSTVSISETEEGIISIYPNPTNDLLNVYIENSNNYELIVITDLNGKILLSTPVSESNYEFSLDGFASGIYFVNILSATESINHKIIKR